MRDLLLRALLVWLGLFVLAFANGFFRELVLVRLMSPAAAAAFSALLLGLLIILAAWLLVRWTPRRYSLKAWFGIGLLWVGLTAVLEFGVFYFLLGTPWQDLLADYDPRYGHFGLIQLTALLAPALCAAWRRSGRSA
jgi:hypothetical protein